MNDEDYKSALASMMHCRLDARLDTPWNDLQNMTFAAETGCYHFFRSSSGLLDGYICWASISHQTLHRIKRHRIYPKYFYEWSEGEVNFVLGLVLNNNKFHHLKSYLTLIKSSSELYAIERKKCLTLISNEKK